MPAELLFDLSHIDLRQRLHDRIEIGRWNPHRGVMALLDAIVWYDEDFNHGVAVKHVRENEFWASGHIPGRPIMPGVLIIEAAAQLASYLYYRRSQRLWFAGFIKIEDVTFRELVLPGHELVLLSKCEKYSEKRFVSRVQGLINGHQLAFEGRISGMAFPKLGDVERVEMGAEAVGTA